MALHLQAATHKIVLKTTVLYSWTLNLTKDCNNRILLTKKEGKVLKELFNLWSSVQILVSIMQK